MIHVGFVVCTLLCGVDVWKERKGTVKIPTWLAGTVVQQKPDQILEVLAVLGLVDRGASEPFYFTFPPFHLSLFLKVESLAYSLITDG